LIWIDSHAGNVGFVGIRIGSVQRRTAAPGVPSRRSHATFTSGFRLTLASSRSSHRSRPRDASATDRWVMEIIHFQPVFVYSVVSYRPQDAVLHRWSPKFVWRGLVSLSPISWLDSLTTVNLER